MKKTFNAAGMLVLILTPFITIACDRAAYIERGYFALGGEVLVPVFCVMLALNLMSFGKE